MKQVINLLANEMFPLVLKIVGYVKREKLKRFFVIFCLVEFSQLCLIKK